MDLKEIYSYLAGGSLLIILLGFIKIPKLEINIWKWLGQKLGVGAIKKILTALDELKKDVKNLRQDFDLHTEENRRESAKGSRQRLLRFNAEIMNGKEHTKEHYDETIHEIDEYEAYCMLHPEYPNNKAAFAIHNIKENYESRMKAGNFR